MSDRQAYLEAFHLGRAFGENDPGQQEQEGVDHQAVHGLSVQEQAGADGFNHGLRILVREFKSEDIHSEKSLRFHFQPYSQKHKLVRPLLIPQCLCV